MRTKKRGHALALTAGALAAALFGLTATAVADTVDTARGFAFGLELTGPAAISARPVAEALLPDGPETSEDTLLNIPADPAVNSATLHVEGAVAPESTIEATLQDELTAEFPDAPPTWNARGYAITEDLAAVSSTVTADVIESESTAACVDGEVVYGSAARIVNLAVGATNVPVLNPSPNQVVFDQLGIRIVLWETNWDSATGTLADGDTVFTNALHVTAPGGIDLVVSHSEASATCAGERPRPPRPEPEPEPEPPGVPQAPPAAPVQGQPSFTG
jgi:hypothetical protein